MALRTSAPYYENKGHLIEYLSNKFFHKIFISDIIKIGNIF